jgi:recombination protein RecA
MMTQAERRRHALWLQLARMDRPARNAAAIPTSYPALDAALGTGGFARGHIIEIFGPESCGKTTVALKSIAALQQAGGWAAYIDADHALDAAYATAAGVNCERLLLSRPEWGEQALGIVQSLAASGTLDLIVLDSAAALAPKIELELGVGAAPASAYAGMLSSALRKIAAAAARNDACVLFLDQIRSRARADSPETTAAGRPLKQWASVRAELAHAGAPGSVRLRVVKNKLGAAFTEAEFDL